MLTYSARELLNYTRHDIWALPNAVYGENLACTIQFDDGPLVTTIAETIYSWYHWRFFRHWPQTPMLRKHHMGAERLTSGTSLRLFKEVIFDIHDVSGGQVSALSLRKEAYECINQIYNDFTEMLGAYVTSTMALDFLEVLEHPEIFEVNEHLQQLNLDDPFVCETADTHIKHAYKVIGRVLKDPTQLPKNRVAEGIKSELLKIGQVQQVFGPRGILQDIDNGVFRRPIMVGFAHGLVTLHDSMLESRAASLALMLTKDPLADVEYFNRELQLVGNVVDHIVNYDCGSTSYVPWTVKDIHMPSLVGKNYVGADGKLLKITGYETHLVNTTILLRSPMRCMHPSATGVCLTCLGDLGLSIDEETNLGHMSVIELCSAVSQNVLSTKHLNGSAMVEDFVVPLYDEPYIRVLADRCSIALAGGVVPQTTKLSIAKKEAPNLNDILLRSVEELSITRITQVTQATFSYDLGDGFDEIIPVNVSMGSRLASFTTEFLAFVAQVGYTTDSDAITISLAGWNPELPIFTLPLKQASMVEFMSDVKSLIKSNGENKGKELLDLSDRTNLGVALADFYDLVSGKFVINIAHLEIILKATMIRSKDRKDYRLPEPGGEAQFGRYSEIIGGRSLAGQAAYQEQVSSFTDPDSFLIRERTPHPFDPIVIPTPYRA